MKTRFITYLELALIRITRFLYYVIFLCFSVKLLAIIIELFKFYNGSSTLYEFSKHVVIYIIFMIALNVAKGYLDEKMELINLRINNKPKNIKSITHSKLESNSKEQLVESRIQVLDELSEDLKFMNKFQSNQVNKNDINDLNQMVGLYDVKKQVQKIKSTIKYEKEHGLTSSIPAFHMKFVGNPGTGKTTVAKIIAYMFYELRITKKSTYISVNANDLLGQYTGHTAPTINALFKKGKGGVIFIDEAYALANVASSNGSGYGFEAVNQLLTQLENNNDTIVIFAGYEYPMEKFFNMNPGLRSRVPLSIKFPDYDAKELIQILKTNLLQYNHDISIDAENLLLDVVLNKKRKCEVERKPFSNARYIRNISKEIHSEHALNYYKDKTIGKTINLKDINCSVLLEMD